MTHKILRKPAVLETVGVKNSTLYDWIAKGAFPKPVPLGQRAVGWVAEEVNAWLETRIQKSRMASNNGDHHAA